MKVKELIDALSKYDPELNVMIQQGEDFEYILAESVMIGTVTIDDSEDEDDDEGEYTIETVLIRHI